MKRLKIVLVAALLAATVSFSATASGAAADMHGHRYDAINIMPVHNGDIVFVGNSITNMHEWWEAFGCEGNILNRGVSGCVTKEVLDNIDDVVAGRPSKVFLMAGTNDLARKELADPYAIARNVERIVRRFRTESPQTRVYVQSVLPVAEGNVRSADDIILLNSLYKGICEREGAAYVDLWSLLVEPGTTHINPAYTKDGLHLYPTGYRVWCKAIEKELGLDCVYADRSFNDCGLPGSLGMRAAAFDMLPLDEDDIVMIGDEMIHGAEWHELMGSPRVKSRGTGWGFGSQTIGDITAGIPAIFSSGKSPSRIFIHAGTGEVARGESAQTIADKMRTLLSAVKAAAPSSKLYLLSVQPIYPSHQKITDRSELDSRLRKLASEFGARYIDISSPLEKGRADGLVRGNFVFGKGYLKIARILSGEMGLNPVPVMFQTRQTAFTGRGNRGETLVTLTVSPEKKEKLREVQVSLEADAADVSSLEIRCSGKVLGSVRTVRGQKVYNISCRRTICDLEDLEVCADISENAVEGHKVSASILKLRFGSRWRTVAEPAPGAREILLRRVRLLGPGDYGSNGYRIPAIVTLPDGTLLTTADKRKYNDLDLPEDIDIIAQRSIDGGLNWSAPVTVVEGKGFNKGFGDAALAVAPNGDVLCAFSGGYGLWASTPATPQGNYICRSVDGGLSWSEPLDCTSRLWGPQADNEECRNYHSAFFGSGRGLCLTKGKYAGRVMFVAAVHSGELKRFDNYIFYSDDNGNSWNVSERAFVGGDEAKVVELPDGRVLLSVRRAGERGYNISEDGGRTWGTQGTWPQIRVNACDGDIICLGDSLLIHSVPNSLRRENVSVFVSRDNGRTWPYVKTVCPYESVYSSLTALPDGTIGMYYEENPEVSFDMVFVNFSVDWLLNRTEKDRYMDFLYESMPLPDSLVHSRAWWEKNVEKTLEVRSTMGWNVPEREFAHFVLPLRVNNEGLDDFRLRYADELCARVKGLSMYDAVLEINHWCHERVTYQPSDGRTSAPMAAVRYGFGRCGEESVVTVAALRAAGIPARQVYTPRWAHTDDNHAWVEAWVDGKWHFLGACEPEPALDMGWFNSPVSRAMLLHTKAFGHYDGPEDVISSNDIYTEINLIRNYVPARRTVVTVRDKDGNPVKDATVDFKIYNYAEYYTVASLRTDENGRAGLDTGLGDIMALAYKGDSFGLAKADSSDSEVVLDHTFGETFSMDFHIIPPVDDPLPAYATKEQVEENAARLLKEDAIRASLHPGVVNRETIDAFKALGEGDEKMAEAVNTVLKSISAKDLRDITPEVLEDAVSDISRPDRYILSPRVEMENLLPFHREIREGLGGKVRTYADALQWVKENITTVGDRNPQHLRIPPVAVWRSRKCDESSLGIFYVALCRAAGIPARISMQNGNVQVREGETWLDVNLKETAARENPRGYLALDTSDAGVKVSEAYFGRFSISKVENGPCRLMDYEYSEEQPSDRTPLEVGYYMMVSGTRLADGSVLAHVQTFNVEENGTVSQKLVLWPAEGEGEKAGSDGCIVARLAENGEPTTHALRQLESAARELNAWGGKILITGPSEKSLEFYRGFISSLENVSFSVDEGDSLMNGIARQCGGDVRYLPFVTVRNAEGKSLYFSQGYNTSLKIGIVQSVKYE
ncbi:MAG: GDSL-type esterase/lipase family protein [Bacteroidales bacterium]|nr:GDSL-type esterase/lipase family protein [Bacteroidales bacterium]